MKAKEGNGQLTSHQAADLRQEATAVQNSLGCPSTTTPMSTANNRGSTSTSSQIEEPRTKHNQSKEDD